MIKVFRKLGLSILVLTLIGTILVGCDSSDEKSNQRTANQTDTSTNADSDKAKALLDKTNKENKEISITKDPRKLKDNLEDNLGEGEIIKNIIIKDKHITLKVDLGNESNGLPLRDLAEVRYAGLSEKLLLNKYWTRITVDFIRLGSITMDTKDAVDGQYFKGIDINKMFKN